jgi:pentatricopeptide repeat protein
LQWERADKLLRHMRAAGVKANRVTYNTRIALCGGMGQWERTLELLEEMKAAGIKPDLVTYNTLIFACGKGQQWEKVCVAQRART